MAAGNFGAWLGGFALALLPLGAAGQGTAAGTAMVSWSMTQELRSMAEASGVIFSGTVISVKRIESGSAGSGAIEVRFSVEDAVQGCTAGGVYTLREWAGLWAGGVDRYRAGQRMLMVLRSPGSGGLSSPVGGEDGAIPLLPPAADATGSGKAQVDLRWIGARVGRPVVYRSATQQAATGLVGSPTVLVARDAKAKVTEGVQSVSVPVNDVEPAPAMVQRAPLDAVLSMLQAWQGGSAGAQ